ncbi:MAG: hypothetical protein ACOCQ1_00790 [Halanaerobiaceae bacterium]
MNNSGSSRQNQVQINSYQDLYDFVKSMKEEFNLDLDTTELVDELIYNWFSQHGVRALDSCYDIFNERLRETGGFMVVIEEGEIFAEWEKKDKE